MTAGPARLRDLVPASLLVAALGGAAAAAPACGPHAMSPAASSEWLLFGGADGRLGCPLGDEHDAAPSPPGTLAREVDFAGGALFLHTSGQRAGQAFVVAACYRWYFQLGGAGGWLGLPLAEALNTPDGQVQRFEGGSLTQTRATDACEATRGGVR
ncbi:MAG: hypothetical protein JOZ27_00075 [Caulobacteraceae bacterium]|nr:hypothetical protein [Caulobacteraceae bacterium]